MERSEFLNLAARYANGEKVTVLCDGIEYYPIAYTIQPKQGGKWSHTVLLKDIHAADSYRKSPLEDIKEVRG